MHFSISKFHPSDFTKTIFNRKKIKNELNKRNEINNGVFKNNKIVRLCKLENQREWLTGK